MRRRSREEADGLVTKYEQSGQTRKAFCGEHGISPATLDNYRKRRAEGMTAPTRSMATPRAEPTVTFVPVEVVATRAAAPAVSFPEAAGCGATLFIELPRGRRIGVTAGFDAATLARLLGVLEQE